MDLQETLRGDVSEYRVYESIASGGFGSVYIGRDTATNVPVAVKRLHPHLKDQPGFVERFEREASTVRGLVHPNIVRVLDQGRDKYGVPFIVLEWVEGLTVGDWLKRRGPYAPAEAADVACQALEGLQAAWSRRVVHRDVKPANLMVTPTGRVKVMDFGVAKDVDLATLAGTSGVIGTPAYMAPEQLRGQPLDGRADIYAMGVTLYQMIAGSPPFMGPTMADYFRQQLQEEPPPIPGLAPALGAVIGRALEKQPEDRYTTPGDMLNALRPFAAEAGIDTSYIPRPGTTPTSSPGTFQSFPPTPYPSAPATPAPIGYSGETIRGSETFPTAARLIPHRAAGGTSGRTAARGRGRCVVVRVATRAVSASRDAQRWAQLHAGCRVNGGRARDTWRIRDRPAASRTAVPRSARRCHERPIAESVRRTRELPGRLWLGWLRDSEGQPGRGRAGQRVGLHPGGRELRRSGAVD